MRLVAVDLWSPDLNPPSEGMPADTEKFKLFFQVAVAEEAHPGHEVFQFIVSSPSALTPADARWVTQTLVLPTFSWDEVRNRISRLLRHCISCRTWSEAMTTLAPFMQYADAQTGGNTKGGAT